MSLSKFIGAKTDEVQAKRERRKEARPGELLDAALDLFVEKGFAATRAEEVAARAGVSKGTLFLYFPSKEELFKAVVRENISGRFTEWNEEFETFEGTTRRHGALLHEDVVGAHGRHPRLRHHQADHQRGAATSPTSRPSTSRK